MTGYLKSLLERTRQALVGKMLRGEEVNQEDIETIQQLDRASQVKKQLEGDDIFTKTLREAGVIRDRGGEKKG